VFICLLLSVLVKCSYFHVNAVSLAQRSCATCTQNVMNNSCGVLVGKRERNGPLVRPWRRSEGIKMDVIEAGCAAVNSADQT
jgi:hypothetical protein